MKTPYHASIRWLALMLMVVLSSISIPASAQAPDDDPDEVQDLLMLGPFEPTRLRLRIEVDGKPFKRAWRETIAKLFDMFDTDHDGVLTREQANQISIIFGAGAVAIPSASKDGEMIAKDGVTKPQLMAHFDKSIPPLKLVQKLSDKGAGPALVPLLDANGDGHLSHEELKTCAKHLHCRDFNDDQLITDLELISGPSLNESADSENSPTNVEGSIIPLTDKMTGQAVAEILLGRYDRNRDGIISLKTPPEVQVIAGSLSKLDTDGDQALSREELKGYVDLPLDANLPFVMGGGKPREKASAGENYRLREKRLIGGYRIQVGSMEINFGFKKGDGNQDENQPILRNFDTNKNGTLDTTEYESVPDRPDFVVVDLDHDSALTPIEFDNYYDTRRKAITAQLLLDATEQGSDLFRSFDLNADRVLSPREMITAPKLMESLDLNHDGLLASNEMSYNLDLMLMRNSPRVQANANAIRRQNALPQVRADRTGPSWFQKMDRNRDGDVGLPEFPGTRQTFAKLDLNGDGLISAEEAGSIETSSR